MLALLLLLLGAPCAALASTEAASGSIPDVATLRARIAAAYGPQPPLLVERVTFTSTDSSGVQQHFRRRSSIRTTVVEGPIRTESGIFRGELWHQNENGHTIDDASGETPYEIGDGQGDLPSASADATTTITRVREPVDAFVMASLDRRGIGWRIFADPETSSIVRREDIAANGRSITEYRDFKAFGSRRLATHWLNSDERRHRSTSYELAEYREVDPGADAVAIPPSRTNLFFPSGYPPVHLPVRLLPNGHWVVRVTVGSRGLDFILDTGASSIIFDPRIAHELGLTLVNREQNNQNAGRFDTSLAVISEMRVGDLHMRDTVVRVAPVDANEGADVEVVGLLGFDFLCEAGFVLDYEHRTVTATVTHAEDDPAPATPRTIGLDVRLEAQVPLVSALVNGVTADRLIFDTGAVGSVLFFESFAQRHPDALPKVDALGDTIRMLGVGGEFTARQYRVSRLQLGSATFVNFAAYRVTTAGSYAGGLEGLIGPAFFELFTVQLDYAHGHIYLSPNAAGEGARVKY